MSYMNRVFSTYGVAIANSHTDQGHKLKAGIKSLQQGKKAFTSSVSGNNPADIRPISGVLGSDAGGMVAGDERKTQADDSFRQVMYISCWGPS
ncbi:hypothetical protein Hanom_Chr17g01542461 [Helianthus anomalus]